MTLDAGRMFKKNQFEKKTPRETARGKMGHGRGERRRIESLADDDQ